MKFRYMSDLHLEFGPLDVPTIEDEKNTYCVLAGDIGVAEKWYTIGPFVREMCERHKAVIYIMGNHEHYQGSYPLTAKKIRNIMSRDDESRPVPSPANLYFADFHEVFEFPEDNVAFIATTFWTNFRDGDFFAMQACQNGMNDYRIIRNGPEGNEYQHKLTPARVLLDHKAHAEFVFKSIAEQKALGRKVVVVTHMAPTWESISPEFRNIRDEQINPGYASDYAKQVLETQPDYWIHGHTHVIIDYKVENTHVLCNPRGYDRPGHLTPGFDPCRVIEL